MPGPTAGGSVERRRQEARLDAEFGEEPRELVLDDVGERADDKQLALAAARHGRGEGGQRLILALGEGRLDAAARIAQHAGLRAEARVEPLGGAREVELDHLGGAGADEEEHPDVGPARQKPVDHAVELLMRVGEAGEVALLDDGGGEARLGEDHHAGGRLDKMGAGARADHEEEGVLDLAMQPDDRGQPAEHGALAALSADRRRAVAGLGGQGAQRRHGRPPASARDPGSRAASRRAALSLSRNWPALTT